MDMCGEFGDLAYELYESLIDGTAPERGPAMELAPDLHQDERRRRHRRR